VIINRDQKTKLFSIDLSRKVLKSPFFFPSISTVKTNFGVNDYFQILKNSGYPGFLVSAYDVSKYEKRSQLIKEISALTENSMFTFMDSGNYESYWHGDSNWDIKKFMNILKDVSVDFAFSFDIFWEEGMKTEQYIKSVIENTAITTSAQSMGETVPLIHGTPNNLDKIALGIIEGINPQIIGITERELGSGLFERAETLKKIRMTIDKTDRDVIIHLLGTGNPISLLLYSLCGADFFDALEWCKTVVNPNNGHLHHFVQKDIFECNCKVCKSKIDYPIQTMGHNLVFYKSYMEEIRTAIEKNQTDKILKKYVPPTAIQKIKKILG